MAPNENGENQAPSSAPASKPAAKSEAAVTLKITTPFSDYFQAVVGEDTYVVSAVGTAVPAAVADELIDSAEQNGITIEKVG